MDHKAALEMLEGHSQTFLDYNLRAYREFDEVHAKPSDPTMRMSVEAARPKWVNERVNYLLEMRYGLSGPVRMVKQPDQLKYLMIEGPDFNIGLRAKKASSDWRSYNHTSVQQDALRHDGKFPGWDVPTHHLLLVYREQPGLQPVISHVAITHEHKFVEIIRLLWTASAGVVPFENQDIQLNLELPPETKMRRRRKPGEDENQDQKKKQG